MSYKNNNVTYLLFSKHFSSFPSLKCLNCFKEMEREDDSSDDDDDNDDIESSLPQDPETCLQMNHVYQEVIQEKIEEVELLLAQNKEQQVGGWNRSKMFIPVLFCVAICRLALTSSPVKLPRAFLDHHMYQWN